MGISMLQRNYSITSAPAEITALFRKDDIREARRVELWKSPNGTTTAVLKGAGDKCVDAKNCQLA